MTYGQTVKIQREEDMKAMYNKILQLYNNGHTLKESCRLAKIKKYQYHYIRQQLDLPSVTQHKKQHKPIIKKIKHNTISSSIYESDNDDNNLPVNISNTDKKINPIDIRDKFLNIKNNFKNI